MVDKVGMGEHGGPERPHGFAGGLGIWHVSRVQAAAAAVRDLIPPRQLGSGDGCPGPFGRAKGGAAALHVDVGGKAAIDDRRTAAGQLGKGNARQRLGVLLRHRRGHADRTHGTGQNKGGDDRNLIGARISQHAANHAIIITQWTAGIDDSAQHRLRRINNPIPKDDLGHL